MIRLHLNNMETNSYKLWEQVTTVHRRNLMAGAWQVKVPENKPVIAASTNPIFGANPVRGRPNLTDRNLRRLTNKKERVAPIHFAVINGMEPGDVKKVKNAKKNLRRKRSK